MDGHKPNIIVTKLHPQLVVGGFMAYCRDYLWVECKSAVHDTPAGWKDLINETVGWLDRPLRSSHHRLRE